ncbi:hypothetical protein HYV88_00850 [Candidatus Woesearchaeota archaeon]|nr:hypothetical protein [Candidatus Woesearchaeota archaeon]
MKFVVNKILILFLMICLLVPFITARENSKYDFMIGTGFLRDFGNVISTAKNGDTIELVGEGSFNTKPKNITGSGTVIHKNSNGEIIGTGKWIVTKLITFQSYGNGGSQGLPDNFEGGRALIKVIIDPDNVGQSFESTLMVTCLLGDKIPPKASEGIRLAIRDIPINFNQEKSGATLFIRKD